MDLHWLKPLLGRPGPFVTVYLDATSTDVVGEAEVAERWKGLRRSVSAADRVSSAVLDEIGELLAVPDGRRTPHGRVLVADAHGVVVDRLLTSPPARSRVDVGPVPALLPVIRAADESVRLLVVAVDRTGADLTRVGTGEREQTTSVDGGHDDVHKTREGDLARRSQTRAEDSWHRNAEAVAHALAKQVAEQPVDLVVLTGDLRTVAMVREAADQHVRECLVEVAGGGRGEGVREDAFKARVADAVAEFRSKRRRAALDRFVAVLGRGDGGVTGLADVVEVLQRGQVAELVMAADALDGPLGTRELWVGSEPLQLATSEGDLAALGLSAPARRMTAHVALVRAALGQDAGVTVAEAGEAQPYEGVGAVLRWSDPGTPPSGSLLSQSADKNRLRALG